MKEVKKEWVHVRITPEMRMEINKIVGPRKLSAWVRDAIEYALENEISPRNYTIKVKSNEA